MKITFHKKILSILKIEILKKKKHPSINSHLMNMIKHYNIDCVLDVGANNGGFGKTLREEGYKGIIHSFEPVSSIYKQLEKTSKKDKNWHIHQLAMGDTCTEKSINVTTSDDFTSFLEPSSFGKKSYEKNLNLSHKEIVNISTIDLFISKLKGQHNIFLKLDTQGYDLNVIKGSTVSLPNITCLLSELSLKPIYDEMTDYLTALKTYNELGFSITGMYPVSRDNDLSLIEIDCMFVNTKRKNQTP